MESYKPGEIVEGYRILSEIGQGAASIIYLVQDPKTKQIWALKHVVKEDPKDQRFLDQAENEYEVSSRVRSQYIRRIERLIKRKERLVATKELWLVMELVDGAALDREPPETFEEAAYVFEQVARGMAEMHAKGFVHADMKPNNIVVNDRKQAKIIDLGQSCAIGTIKERIQGTPDYIAPEQVHRREITHKTDIFNLGATMYWALTRQNIPTALAKETSLVGSREDHLIERARRPVDVNPRVHKFFDELVMDCVETDPEKRPESMTVVADKLNLIYGVLRAERERAHSNGEPPPT